MGFNIVAKIVRVDGMDTQTIHVTQWIVPQYNTNYEIEIQSTQRKFNILDYAVLTCTIYVSPHLRLKKIKRKISNTAKLILAKQL